MLYFLRESSGVLRQIDQDQHAALSESRAGPIKYYRRERPRLAEVEVWTEGDNISLGSLSRGGLIGGTSNTGTERLAIDGDYKTVWTEQVGVSDVGNVDVEFDRELLFDLGTWFWISRVVIGFDRENIAHGFTGAFPNYVINLSNGQRNPDGSLAYAALATRKTADIEPGRFSGLFPHIFYQDNAFPLTRGRYLKMDYRVLIVPNWANSGIRELQLYGRGFLPQVTLQSAPMELGSDPRILSSVHWAADTPSGHPSAISHSHWQPARRGNPLLHQRRERGDRGQISQAAQLSARAIRLYRWFLVPTGALGVRTTRPRARRSPRQARAATP